MSDDDAPRDLFGEKIAIIAPRGRRRPATTPPPSLISLPNDEPYIAYRMDWAALRWAAISSIALIIGLVYDGQLEFFKTNGLPNQVYVTASALAIVYYSLMSLGEAWNSLLNKKGDPPRRKVVYESVARARWSRIWRSLVAVLIVAVCLCVGSYARNTAAEVAKKIYDYGIKNAPLTEQPPPPPKPKKVKPPPEKPFLEDPWGWLERNSKPAPLPGERP